MKKNMERSNKIGREEPEYSTRRKTFPNINLTITNLSWTERSGCNYVYQNREYWRDVVVIRFSAEHKELHLKPTRNSCWKFALYPDFSTLYSVLDGSNFNRIIE
jgi:hypothetical protein